LPERVFETLSNQKEYIGHILYLILIMSAKYPDILSQLLDKEEDHSSSFYDTASKYLYHWPLYVIGLAITMSVAVCYILTANPVYSVTASIIINDEKKLPDEKEKLEEIDNSNTPKLAENEVEVLKSRNLISQVVNDLALWTTYEKKSGLRMQDLYKESPVTFKLLQGKDSINGQFFDIIIKDKNSFFIKKSNGEFKKFSFNDVLDNSFGQWKLQPTKTLQKYIGAEIMIVLGNQEKVAERYQKAIDVNMPNKLAPTIELSLQDNVEQRAKDVLNHLIALYDQTTINDRNQTTEKTIAFIDKRINDLVSELNNSENTIQGFRSSKGLTNISSQAQVYLQNVQVNDAKLNEVNVQLKVIDDIERYINSPQSSQNVPATIGLITDISLNHLVENLSQLQLQREKMLASTPETNPVFESVNRQIRTVKQAIKESIQNIKSSLLATKDELEKFNAQFESSIRNIPGQERELMDKTRQQSIKENLYVYLLQKREEVSLNYASIKSDARVVDYAYANGAQSIQKVLVGGVAFLLGLLLPSGFIYSRNRLNNRVVSRAEIEKATGLPVFGELSYAKTASPIIVFDKDNIVVGEEFRTLRTNLHFLKDKAAKGVVTLITSSISAEGKSFVSANLGVVLAVSGKKTIILELDLRKPKISAIFNLSPSHPGLSSYVVDQLPLTEIIQNSNIHPNLDILGSGPLPSDPSELLGMNEIDSLINILRLDYDYIIIDTAPISLVTDAKILSRLSDITLYVIRQAFTYKSLLRFIRDLSKDEQFLKMKIIFNGIQKGRYGYGYSYGNQYYQTAKTRKINLDFMFSDFWKRF
jgi:tyrosine-protein kinase Etk/Wzc